MDKEFSKIKVLPMPSREKPRLFYWVDLESNNMDPVLMEYQNNLKRCTEILIQYTPKHFVSSTWSEVDTFYYMDHKLVLSLAMDKA